MFYDDKQDQNRIDCRLGLRSKTVAKSSHYKFDQCKQLKYLMQWKQSFTIPLKICSLQ